MKNRKPFDKNKIPIWLRRTPEQQAQDDRYQEELKQALGPGRRPNPTEARLLRAAAVRRAAEAQLQHLVGLENPDPLHLKTAEAQLADALAEQGHYSDAAELHPSAEHAERYRAIAAAIDRPDDEQGCQCELQNVLDPQTNRPILLQNEIVSEYIFSPKHGRLMPVVQCVKCGDMNVKPAPAHLTQRLQGVREQHRQAKGGPRHVAP